MKYGVFPIENTFVCLLLLLCWEFYQYHDIKLPLEHESLLNVRPESLDMKNESSFTSQIVEFDPHDKYYFSKCPSQNLHTARIIFKK